MSEQRIETVGKFVITHEVEDTIMHVKKDGTEVYERVTPLDRLRTVHFPDIHFNFDLKRLGLNMGSVIIGSFVGAGCVYFLTHNGLTSAMGAGLSISITSFIAEKFQNRREQSIAIS